MTVTIARNMARTAWLVIGPATPDDPRTNILNFCVSKKQAIEWCKQKGYTCE